MIHTVPKPNSTCGRTLSARRLAPALALSIACFTTDVRAQTSGQPWSSLDTWGGFIPSANTDVVIPHGKTVLLDSDAHVRSLTIHGTLRAMHRNVSLTAGSIKVEGGLFEIGATSQPFAHKAVITLTGPRPSSPLASQKGFIVMNGGRLELHGASRSKESWTQLASHARAGTTTLQTLVATGWQPGDRIVLATTALDPNANDTVTVTAVTGTEVRFTPALRYDHFGQQAVYGGKTLDMRGEVALLTHNILIQGDASSVQSHFGGHVMIMQDSDQRPTGGFSRPPSRGSRAFVEGVEFFRMGQRRLPGRYPFHWHLVGDATGQTIRRCSVHSSFHRAVAVHGTDNALVEDVVAFDIDSHAFVPSEDGDEVGNRFLRNLGLLVRTVEPDDFAFPEANKPGRTAQSEQTAGIFWLRNPANTLRGNHAVGGAIANGFFFDTSVGGDPNNSDIIALAQAARRSRVITDFDDNLAHSIFNPSVVNAAVYRPRAHGWGVFADSEGEVTLEFRRFTAYKTQQGGAWLESGSLLIDSIISDSHMAASVLDRPTFDDCVFVGQTINTFGAPPKSSRGGIHFQARTGSNIEATIRDVQFINLPIGILVEQSSKLITSGLSFRDCTDTILITSAAGGRDVPRAPIAGSKNGTYTVAWLDRVAASEGTPAPSPQPEPSPAPQPSNGTAAEFEIEALSLQTTTGASHVTLKEAGASGGQWVTLRFDLNATGAALRATFSAAPGRYTLELDEVLADNHANVAVAVNGRVIGVPHSQSSRTERFATRAIGPVELTSAGPHTLELRVAGPNPTASRGRLGFDAFRLVP